MMRKQFLILLIGIALMVLPAACSSEDDGNLSEENVTPTETVTGMPLLLCLFEANVLDKMLLNVFFL